MFACVRKQAAWRAGRARMPTWFKKRNNAYKGKKISKGNKGKKGNKCNNA